MIKILNGQISEVNLSMEHGVLVMWIAIKGDGWNSKFGGTILGFGSLGCNDFKGSIIGTEYIMHVMDTLNVRRLNDMLGKYIRVEIDDFTAEISAIGHIIDDKWFNKKKFIEEKKNQYPDEFTKSYKSKPDIETDWLSKGKEDTDG